MTDVFFPNSSKSIPKTNDERAAAIEPPTVSRTVVVEDPPDLPGEEMAKDARVWKTYVKEADRWDKEMIDGRNSSLDVMLIFAALFSAISTAFIIESLGDLKPDLADESTQTLLFISQTLTAMANGQPAPSPPVDTFNPQRLSLPRSAVVVNVLWLLSLSLSVAVSLIAMLAKDWCYKFMSGRSGPIYEQARKRQEKWNGMERWKMAEMLVYLPVAMHLALLLFAVGLCVYLWDINIGVAVPVVMITGLATVIYAFATVLPLFDRFCPYNTPIATIVASLVDLAKTLRRMTKTLRWMAYSATERRYMTTNEPKWLESVLKHLSTWLKPGYTRHYIFPNLIKDNGTPMDLATSQMLAWLITNCEDSRSVDIALQAIAGAHSDLPHASLAQCQSIDLAASRLQTLAQSLTTAPRKLSVDELPRLYDALRYGRACAILLSGDSYEASEDRWRGFSTNAVERKEDYGLSHILHPTYMNLWELARQQGSQSKNLEITAAAAAAAMPFCHWTAKSYYSLDHAKLSTATGTLASALQDHLQGTNTILPPSTLYAILESLAHYLVGLWPREVDHEKTALIPILVARVFVTSYGTSPDISRAAAVTLAAAAFASHTYPGGEEPTQDVNARERRAVSMLSYYRGRQLDNEEVLSLFGFGFLSWLPMILSSSSLEQLAGFNSDLIFIMHDTSQAPDLSSTARIWSLPEPFSILDHAVGTVSARLTPATDDTSNKAALASSALLPWLNDHLHIEGYLVALISLCHAESKTHRKICMQVIAKQPIPMAGQRELKYVDGKYCILEQVCHSLFSTNSTVIPFVALHFGLLLASIITSDEPIADRKSVLRPLLSLHDECSSLEVSKPFIYSDLFSYLEESLKNGPTNGTLLRVMQFLLDFCDGSPDDPRIAGPDGNWYLGYELKSLKVNYQSKLEQLEELLAKSPRDTVLPA